MSTTGTSSERATAATLAPLTTRTTRTTRTTLAAFAARTTLALLAATVLVRPTVARAADAPLEAAEQTLERDRDATRLWYFGWSAIFAVATGANVAAAFAFDDAGLRADARVGAVKSGLGFVSTIVLPPPSLFYTPCSDAERATAEGRARCAARQNERLRDAADLERLGRSWLPHVASVAVNLGGLAYSWLHDNRLVEGILASVVGLAVSEAKIFTQPTTARDAVGFAVVPTPTGVFVNATLAFGAL